MRDFPKKFETHIADGDLGYGYHEVYYASEIDAWMDELKKTLRTRAYDPKVLQHGNEARMILKILEVKRAP